MISPAQIESICIIIINMTRKNEICFELINNIMLVSSIFSFSYIVFKRHFVQGSENLGLFCNELNMAYFGCYFKGGSSDIGTKNLQKC